MPENRTTGLSAIGLTIPGHQLLGGFARKLTLVDGGNPFEPCQPSNTRGSGPWLAHGRSDQERQSKDSRSMHGIMALRRNFAVVKSLSCSPTPRQEPAWKNALSACQQEQHHVFSHTQMNNFDMTIELDPKGEKITPLVFWPVLLSFSL